MGEGKKSYEAAMDGGRKPGGGAHRRVLRYTTDSVLYRDLYFDLNRNQDFTSRLGRFLDDVSGEVKRVLDAKIPVLIYSGPSFETTDGVRVAQFQRDSPQSLRNLRCAVD